MNSKLMTKFKLNKNFLTNLENTSKPEGLRRWWYLHTIFIHNSAEINVIVLEIRFFFFCPREYNLSISKIVWVDQYWSNHRVFSQRSQFMWGVETRIGLGITSWSSWLCHMWTWIQIHTDILNHSMFALAPSGLRLQGWPVNHGYLNR